ncbi:MAG: MoaD/ThiS family protein [cyanobacterium endosymbiont of Rhopalodia gibba]
MAEFSVNFKLTNFNYLLKDGYEIIFIPPVSGGYTVRNPKSII